MAAQAEHVGTRIVHDLIADFTKHLFRCDADSGDLFIADVVPEQRLQGRACQPVRPAMVSSIVARNTAVRRRSDPLMPIASR